MINTGTLMPTHINEKHLYGTNPFQSFWMAGFECTDKTNAFGDRVDLLIATGHDQHLAQDYDNVSELAMNTVREGIRWSQVEKQPYVYDFSIVKQMLQTAKAKNIQIIWDICHFGFADDLTPLHPMFARRFAALCRAFVRFYNVIAPGEELVVTPINEVSFLSWLGGDVCGTSPYCRGYGWEVKYALMRAYIEGIEAMKEEMPGIRIMTTEPLVSIVPTQDATEEEMQLAAAHHEDQFQVLEILCGNMCPELRGKPEYLDILGFNFYYNNQWEDKTHNMICWKQEFLEEAKWKPLSTLLAAIYVRYERPVVLSETSHPGEDRPLWMKMIADECLKLLRQNIPLWGVCWYPIIDRPDWDYLHIWHHSGLWDGGESEDLTTRLLHDETISALAEAQLLLHPSNKYLYRGRYPVSLR